MYAVNKFGNYECPCCGFFTLDEGRSNSFDICEVCYWEDDGIQFSSPDYEGGANAVSLNQAHDNYRNFGSSEEAYLKYVRPPSLEEMPD